ncbi:MAG: hypothetical protein KY460_15345 [Actinobacteria bacterium]|nr:hypothetical protein [Actinomycetota bacterium]
MVIAVAGGLVASGLVILTVGVTVTFVHSDLEFLGVTAGQLEAINPRLIPLIAHDRVGFAGAVVTGGVLIGVAAWWGEGPAVRQAIGIAGLVAFGSSLAIHLTVGYTDLLHLAPNLVGPVALGAGMLHWVWACGQSTPAPLRNPSRVADEQAH